MYNIWQIDESHLLDHFPMTVYSAIISIDDSQYFFSFFFVQCRAEMMAWQAMYDYLHSFLMLFWMYIDRWFIQKRFVWSGAVHPAFYLFVMIVDDEYWFDPLLVLISIYCMMAIPCLTESCMIRPIWSELTCSV